jgi:hypothetical protein
MMAVSDVLKELAQTAKEVATTIGKKAGDTLEVQKLSHNLRELNRLQDKDYQEIGKAVYAKFQLNEVVDEDNYGICEIIEQRESEIDKLGREITRVKSEGK